MISRADIGHPVQDEQGRVGILRDVIADYEDPADMPAERRKKRVAFLGPENGGREWTAPPQTVRRLPSPGSRP
ncbi:hypothetical protein [Streptomyces sp. NPDC058548]|uniref:hypothetical protein n=1 Tax=Streptomyces sp. NPDC058548 TaxID=3346545 RepID=UPI0036573852